MQVLINGAGIAGSTLAWHLARLDYKVTVLERSKAYLGQGQNIDISAGAITILKRMGLLEEVRKFNTTEKGTIFLDRAGKPIATFPIDQMGASPTAEFEILRGDLALILYNATKDHPNITYRFDMSVEELISNDESSVKIKLTDGSVNSYDIAFAADGQGSRLRRLAFPKEDVHVVDRKAYIAYWTIPRQPEDDEYWYVYWGLKSRVISQRPDPHGTMRVCLTKMPLDDEEKEAWEAVMVDDKEKQKAMVERHFDDAGWQTRRFLDAMKEAPDFYIHGLKQIKMKQWATGSVVCLGDAAHAATPITGQGTTLAITGAYILAGELSKLGDGTTKSEAFEAYDKVYHGHVNKVLDVPSFVPGIAHPSTRLHLWALEAGVIAASKLTQIPLLTKAFGGGKREDNDNGFPLPEYPVMDSKLGLANA